MSATGQGPLVLRFDLLLLLRGQSAHLLNTLDFKL